MDEESAALVELLQTTKRAPMRLEAVRQLAARGDPETAPALLAVLVDSNDLGVVPVVTAALGGLEAMGPAIVPYVLTILDDLTDHRRVFMPLLLTTAAGEAAIPRLVQALTDPQPAVQINAATQLGQTRSSSAFAPLLALLQDSTQPPTVRGIAAAALGALRDPRALPVLTALAATDSTDLLAGVIDGLADLRDPKGIPYLEAILDRPDLDERANRAVRLGLLAMERYRDR